MKKLLSLLSVTTLTGSVPAPLLANTTLTRTKRDIGSLISNSNTDYVPIKKINGINEAAAIAVDSNDNIYFAIKVAVGTFVLKHGETTPTKINDIIGIINSIAVDSKDNIYFGTNIGAFVLKQGSDTPTKINGISYATAIAVDSSNNIYFGTTDGLFVLKQGETTPTKINGIDKTVVSLTVDSKDNVYFSLFSDYVYKLLVGTQTPTKINGITFAAISLAVDSSNNIYFGSDKIAFVLKHGETTPTKIDGINGRVKTAVDSNDNIYFGTNAGAYIMQTALSWVKTNINVNLIDNTKNIVWLRDNQLVANGQVKVKMANTDIETVKVNGTIMPSPDKNWDFDLPTDSTTVENKDYQIEIAFKVDGKSYTGQIIVSSLLSQPSITVQKNTSPFGNVDSYVYQVPTNDKVGDITLTSDLYYSDTEVKVSLNKPTGSTVQSGVVYGLNDKWQKNGQTVNITGDVSLNATMLNSYQGRFLVETKDSAVNSSFYYISLNKNNLTPNFWNTNQGQQFYAWANLNGYNESIKKLNATELNKIINESKNWQQLASDSQFAIAVADWFKTNGKLSPKEPLTKEQVIEQLKTQIPSSIKIPAVNTSNYDINKFSFVLNQTDFKPNDKVNITVKYNSATSEQFTLQIKDSNTPDNNKKGGLSGWAIVGIVLGSLAGLATLGWLLKRFVINPFILGPISDKKQKTWRIREDKALAEMQAEEEAEKAKRGK